MSRPAVFLDRDGVITKHVHYLHRVPEIDGELACRLKQEPRLRFAALAVPAIGRRAEIRVMGAVVDAVDTRAFLAQHS